MTQHSTPVSADDRDGRDGSGAAGSRRPLVVLVRPTDVETDSRAKKIGISLDRIGYDVVVLGRSGSGKRQEGRIGGARVTLLVPQSRLRGAHDGCSACPRAGCAAWRSR